MTWIRKNPLAAGVLGTISLGVGLLTWVLVPILVPANDTPTVRPSEPTLAAPYSSIDGLARTRVR